MAKEIIGSYFAEFPARLRHLMKAHNVKQLELSSALGLKTRQSITGYLDGSVTPPLDKLIAIADFFDVSIDWLLCRPGATLTRNANIQSVCNYLKLSESAVSNILSIADMTTPEAAEISPIEALSLFLQYRETAGLCANLATLYNKENRRKLTIEEMDALDVLATELSATFGMDINIEPKQYTNTFDDAQNTLYEIVEAINCARIGGIYG